MFTNIPKYKIHFFLSIAILYSSYKYVDCNENFKGSKKNRVVVYSSYHDSTLISIENC